MKRQKSLQKATKKAIVFENNEIYACLASFPITPGHTVVVWKKKARDISELSKKEYEALMDNIDCIRNALMETVKVNKVYLLYMDEINQVHWHLIPRYNQKGYNILKHRPSKISSFPLAKKLRESIIYEKRNKNV